MTQSTRMVAIDAQILGWYVKDATKDADPRVRYAQWLIDSLIEEGTTIVVASIALSEFLYPIDSEDRTRAWAAIGKCFEVASHDAACAALSARLTERAMGQRKRGVPHTRQVAKADAEIVASVKHYGATVFYSNDAGCRDLATQAGMEAKDLPNIAPGLFEDRPPLRLTGRPA